MSILNTYESAFGKFDLSSKSEMVDNLALMDIAVSLSSAAVETLRAAFKDGPLFDGDVPSKCGRDELLEHGLVAMVINEGGWGFNACTYKGAWAMKVIDATKKEPK